MMEPTDILGNIKLYNGDCLEVMKTFKDKQFSLAICDPPYGINFAKTHTGKGWTVRESKDWDKEIPPLEYWQELFRVSKNQIVWGGNYFTDYLPPSMGWIMWDKGQRDFSLADGELAWTSFNKALRIFEMSRGKALAKNNEQGGRFHPTQKPEMLYSWILQNYAKEGDTILDTHFGSLSIGIACHDMNFDLTAIELDKDYYEMAKKRLINHQRQLTLF